MIIVHGGALSPFVRKVRMFLGEKGLDYELRSIAPFPKTPELLAMSPLGKIPILEEDGFQTPDSSVICAYLERRHPEPPLYPTDARELARALWFEEYADTKLVEVLTTSFFERVIKPGFFGSEPDEERVRKGLEADVPPVFDYLESQAPDGEGIVAGRFSIADIALASPLVSFKLAGEWVDRGRWPKLADYAERVLQRPVLKALAEEPLEPLQPPGARA